MYPHEVVKLNTTIETTKNKRNNRQRTRVLPPRNNAHLQTSCTSPLYHLAQESNNDWQYVADARGAAEYTVSYALKPEQPDSRIMQDICSVCFEVEMKLLACQLL